MNMIKICEYLEKFCAWSYDNGVFYISGRDIYCLITGFLIAFVVFATVNIFIRREEKK